MAAIQVDLAKKAAAAASKDKPKVVPSKAAAVADEKTFTTTITNVKPNIETNLDHHLRLKTSRKAKEKANVSLKKKSHSIEVIQALSKRYPLPSYRPPPPPPSTIAGSKSNINSKDDQNGKKNKKKVYYQKPVKLEARVCLLQDASFLRRYLIEERERESLDAKFDLGDLVWAKLKGQPWWPAMVSVHPQRDCYLKYHSNNHILYHVQFFGVIHRCWVAEKELLRFRGFDHFEAEMLKKVAGCPPASLTALWKGFSVGRERKALFGAAVGEAEAASRLTAVDRLSTLTYRYYSKRYCRYFEL